MSQAEAARSANVVPSYLAQIEHGHRPPSRKLLEALEVVYGVRRRKYTDRMVVTRRGPKQRDAQTRQALKQLTQATETGVIVPVGGRRRGSTGIQNVLWPMAVHLGPAAQAEVNQLESIRADDETFWNCFNRIEFDSWCEKRFMVLAALSGGVLTRVSCHRLGIAAPPIGCDARVALVLQREGLSAAFIPQVSVLAGGHVRRLDFLVVISNGKRRSVVDVEIDGPHHDAVRDARRAAAIGLPTLRIPVAALDEQDLMGRVFTALRRCLN